MRAGELNAKECKAQIHESSRAFTERYTEAVNLAKQLANDTGAVKLRRLASTDASWEKARGLSEFQASLPGSSVKVLNDHDTLVMTRQ